MSLSVDVTDVTVRAADRTRLDAVSVTVTPGRVHALIGANGSGKSTLLTVIAGELVPDSGLVTISPTSPAGTASPPRTWKDFDARQSARLRALLAQDTPIAFSYSVADVIRWGRLAWQGTPDQRQDEEVLDEEIAANDIAHLLDRRITELSGGERARVHLARVLCQRAPLLLLDEADATLDLAGQSHLDAAVQRRRAAGDAIVIISHDLTRVARLADDVTVLENGRVLAAGAMRQTMTADVLSEAYGVAVDVQEIEGSLLISRR
jgi:iron complex transport system ATP-binding protein